MKAQTARRTSAGQAPDTKSAKQSDENILRQGSFKEGKGKVIG